MFFGFKKKKKQEEELFYYEGKEQEIVLPQQMEETNQDSTLLGKVEERKAEERTVTIKIVPENSKERMEGELNICFSSIIGSREYQQDCLDYKLRKNEFLGVVCDGMGGMSGGELASQRAVHVLVSQFEQTEYPLENVPKFLYNTAKKMDFAVADLEDKNGNSIQGGTTAVSVYICDGRLHYMSVGDSKIYVIRDKKMVSITREHNYKLILDQSLRENAISFEEYEEEIKKGEALISYIGMGNVKLIDVNQNPFLLQEGDMVLLCSDGLYKSFSEREIQNVLELCSDNFEDIAAVMTETVLKYGKKPLDNCSILLVKYQGKKMNRRVEDGCKKM